MADYTDLILTDSTLTLSGGDTATGTVILNGGILDVSGGQAVSTGISGGTQKVISGNVTDSWIEWGNQLVSGGNVNSTLIRGGTQQVTGGNVDNTMLTGGAQLIAGGNVDNTAISGGSQMISSGNVTNTVIYGGFQLVSGGNVDYTTVSGGSQIVAAGTVSGTLVSGGGQLVSGGNVSGTAVRGGALIVRQGNAWGTELSGGQLVVSGGLASGTVLWSGDMSVSGGEASDTRVVNGRQFIYGGLVSGTVLMYGNQYVSGGTAADTIVSSGTTQTVASGGTAAGGGILAGGVLATEAGAVLAGTIIIEGTLRAEGVTDCSQASLVFSIVGRDSGEAAFVTNLDNLVSPDITVKLTAPPGQEPGKYRLADGASSFSGSITLESGDTQLSRLKLNDIYTIDGTSYMLVIKDDTLYLSVGNDYRRYGFEGEIPAGTKRVAFTETLDPGKYFVSGDFGDMSGRIRILDGKGKTAASGSVKNGKVSFKEKLLPGGTYTVVFEAKSASTLSREVDIRLSGNIYTRGNNGDDWTDIKKNGDASLLPNYDLGNVTGPMEYTEWVGYGDAADYRKFTLVDNAHLSLSVAAAGKVKLEIYTLEQKKNGTFALRKVRGFSVSAGKTASLNDLVLLSGDYYIMVKSADASKGGSADYTVSVNGSSKFFDKGNNADDWTDMKTHGDASLVQGGYDLGSISGPGSFTDWVGFGDEVDYRKITLDSGAQLSLSVAATDKVQFGIYQLVAQKNGFKLKKVVTLNVSAAKVGTITRFLDSGDYYFLVKSTNASKGGDADYTVRVDGNSKFFSKGNNLDDWTDMKTRGDVSLVERGYDLGTLGSGNREFNITDWVGYGDEVDYRKFNVGADSGVSITLNASDKTKLTVYQLVSGKKGYSLKKVASISVSGGFKTLDQLQLAAGAYYLGIESTNASKGGDSDYMVDLRFHQAGAKAASFDLPDNGEFDLAYPFDTENGAAAALYEPEERDRTPGLLA